jgi:hypothetical protein
MRKEHDIRYGQSSAFLALWLGGEVTFDRFKLEEFPHLDCWIACLNTLMNMGFRVTVDPRIKKDYPILSKYHKYGNWNGLEVKTEIYPAGFRFEFYQNFNTGDRAPGDGEYAFRKFQLMPYLVNKRFILTCARLRQTIEGFYACSYTVSDMPSGAVEAVIRHKQECCHRKTEIHGLEDLQYQMSEYDKTSRNSIDRDGKRIECGQVKYFRDYRTGRLLRGRVYHNLNNMWWVIVNGFYYTNIAAFDLFDPTHQDMERRRVRPNRMPTERRQELELLHSLSAGQLQKLLNRKKKLATAN